ncbi:uncharacterized protein LOC117114591 [Anneissia japonica]|uniref:uncharacterized protein LOC117114591 n=1 Tax=Anneissia japonica TaxID=1529436 RepID=UPI001425B537|nr:uncharacterized protein LOC117114591 [Anneissia japonica]
MPVLFDHKECYALSEEITFTQGSEPSIWRLRYSSCETASSGSHYRLVGTEVRIGNVYTNTETAQKCGNSVSNKQVETSAIVDLTCDEPISGRYLMLWHPDQNEFLNVCEIRVYSEYEPEISECSHSQSYSDYRGLVSITENGHVCQKWSSQSPHTHNYGPSNADDNGIGDHNLCRNPDNEDRPWCYTTDPDTRWDYCDVADVGASCPIDTIVDDLNAVAIFELNCDCLTSWYASEILLTREVDATCTSDTDNLQPVNTLISVESNRFQDTNALTLAMYVYPNGSSSGEILSAGSGNTRLRIEQTYSNGYLFRSEVTVFYGDQQLTRAHVLLPEVWTFLAITFDGTNKNIKLWRDGEIASIGYIDFTNLDLFLNEFTVRVASDSFYAKFAMLQIYDRVLNEAEMKAARDTAFESKTRFFFSSNEEL